MSEGHSTPRPVRCKPTKPYPDFPLFPHVAGVWAKKIRGKTFYFGSWDDPDAALAKYLDQKDALHAGRTPRPDPDACLVKEVANSFLIAKQALVDVGELSPRSWADYKSAVDAVVEAFGKRRLVVDLAPEDFAALRNKLAKQWGPHRLAKTIQITRSLFKYAFEAGLLSTPLRFGPGFKRPSKKTMRLHKVRQGVKLFNAEEIRRLLDAASVQLKAMILLGVNCGFGNADCGHLPASAVDLDRGWIDYPRPKTGIPRRCSLWPETVQAIIEALAERSEPKDHADAGLVFITKYGQGWAKDTSATPLSAEFRKLMNGIGVGGHRNFYTLRHTFRTVADEAKDQPAADLIMGHARDDMASVYRETIADERLRAVTEHVRRWLFPAGQPSVEATPG